MRNPILARPNVLDAWIGDDWLVGHGYFDTETGQLGAGIAQSTAPHAVLADFLQADFAFCTVLVTIGGVADRADVRTRAAQDLLPVHTFDAVRLTGGLAAVVTGDGVFGTKRIAAGDTFNTAVRSQRTSAGGAAGIQQ